MDDNRNIHFAISVVGANHLPKDVPCQDYSISWESEDKQNIIAIVCDGHGSSTYVRSDTGSKLAANITLEVLKEFATSTNPALFIYTTGDVTARRSMDENEWLKIPNIPVTSMTEVESENFKQNQLFCNQVSDIKQQDQVLTELFNSIYLKWIEAIKEDALFYPFSDIEKQAVGKNRIEKAYGTTLLAYLQTPYFWLSFQIGDGIILFVDRKLTWMQMVPWDCNCFLNSTTSLCNSNPLPKFRYAFDGTGYFPAAVLCCSDGIEDSYGYYELAPQYLHKFYNGLLKQFAVSEMEEVLKQLREFLPKLSAIGSKDDMSIAGFINTEAIKEGLVVLDIYNQRDALNSQHEDRVKEQESLEKQISDAEAELSQRETELAVMEKDKSSFNEIIQNLKQKIQSLIKDIEEKDSGIEALREEIEKKTLYCETLKLTLESKIDENLQLDNKARAEKSALRQQFEEIEQRIEELQRMDIEAWKERLSKKSNNNDSV